MPKFANVQLIADRYRVTFECPGCRHIHHGDNLTAFEVTVNIQRLLMDGCRTFTVDDMAIAAEVDLDNACVAAGFQP